MKEFKVGQTVELIKDCCGIKAGVHFNVVGSCKNESVWIDEKTQEVSEHELNLYYSDSFKLVGFDLHKEKWFFKVSNKKEWETSVNWLKTQGFNFERNGNGIVERYEENIVAIGSWPYKFKASDNKRIGHTTTSEFWKEEGHKEIFIEFKTIIDSVTYPEPEIVETESQKQMKVLEEQIQKLIVEKDKLKETIGKESK